MKDIVVTGILAVGLTFVVVPVFQLERGVGVIGITFAMCVLVAGVIVRLTTDSLAKRKGRRG